MINLHKDILYVSEDVYRKGMYYGSYHPYLHTLKLYIEDLRIIEDKFLDNNTVLSLDPDICKILKYFKESL